MKANAFQEPRKTKKLAAWYQKRLRKISKQIDLIAQLYKEETDPIIAAARMQERLFAYSDLIRPWASEVATLMCEHAAKADFDTWTQVAQGLSRSTRETLKDIAIGSVFDKIQADQVELITSLPRNAAQTVHEWTKQALATGQRYPEISKRIMTELGQNVEFKAIRVARTETARARTNFTMARAKAIGSTHYIWRTVNDGAVREMHTDLNGTIHAWDDPPVCEVGKGGKEVRANPGCVWNCRCFAEPILDKERLKLS